jgi:archaellum component FlaC
MLLYAVILFGLVVVLQLRGISQRLESNHSAVQDLKEELQGIGKKIAEIAEELHWYKDSTFAHDLKEWLEEVPKDVVEELQWHKSSTFAHELREWLQEISKDITGELQAAAGELRAAATDILNTLSTIENNTSHD